MSAVLVYEPNGAPANDKMAHVREVPKMTVGRAALVEFIRRYLGGLLDQHDISRARFERVTRLVEGIELPYGLELLATVHWGMSRAGTTQHASVERRVHDWSARRRQFTPRQLAIAEERLHSQGRLSAEVALAH